jgi:hypothetical protein
MTPCDACVNGDTTIVGVSRRRDIAEAYCRPGDARRLQRSLHLVESVSPNVVLHVVSELWPFDPDERVAPALVTALDLIESTDQRTQRAGRDLPRRSAPGRA